MITKKIRILATLLAIGVSNLNFSAEKNPMSDQIMAERYNELLSNFSTKTNQFKDGFIDSLVPKHDSMGMAYLITIVSVHKTNLETEVAQYQKSWMPLLLKFAGASFGANAALTAAYMIMYHIPVDQEYKDPIYRALELPRTILYPIRKPVETITRPASNKLFNMYKEETISGMTFDIGDTLFAGSKAMFSAGIAAWLFKKANSYQETIERLKAEITVDDQMIKALKNVFQQNSK